MFGIDGVIIGLIITFVCLFAGILSGFPVAFGIGGAGIVSFGILAVLDFLRSYGSLCDRYLKFAIQRVNCTGSI